MRTAAVGSVVLAGAVALSACGSGSGGAAGAAGSTVPPTRGTPPGGAGPGTSSSASTVASTSPTSTVPPTPVTTNFGAGVIGTVLTAVGTTLTPPTAPTVHEYTVDCATLLDPGYSGQCLILQGPGGSLAAIVETRSGGEQAGAGEERDLVYTLDARGWNLALRRVRTSPGPPTQLEGSDIMRDGDPKAVFVERAADASKGTELDVVEVTGQVTLYRQLQGGLATAISSGGLETFVPSSPGSSGYDDATITYSGGAWHLASDRQVGAADAPAAPTGPFSDSQGTMPDYYAATP